MKKFVVSTLAVVLLFASMISTSIAASTSFVDVDNSYAKDAILELQAKGIIDGMDDTHFDPTGTLTRAQFVAIMVRAMGLEAKATTSTFTDVPDWAIPYVDAAFKAGIINGVGVGLFDPSTPITREAAVTILVRALTTKGKLDETATVNFTDADQISDWAKPYIAIAVKYGLISGYPDGTFNPRGIANREMAATMGKNLLVAIVKVISETPKPITPEPIEPEPTEPTPAPIIGGGGGGRSNHGGGGTPTVKFFTKPSFTGAFTTDFKIEVNGNLVTNYLFYYDGKLVGKDRNGSITSVNNVFTDMKRIQIKYNDSGAIVTDSDGAMDDWK